MRDDYGCTYDMTKNGNHERDDCWGLVEVDASNEIMDNTFTNHTTDNVIITPLLLDVYAWYDFINALYVHWQLKDRSYAIFCTYKNIARTT